MTIDETQDVINAKLRDLGFPPTCYAWHNRGRDLHIMAGGEKHVLRIGSASYWQLQDALKQVEKINRVRLKARESAPRLQMDLEDYTGRFKAV